MRHRLLVLVAVLAVLAATSCGDKTKKTASTHQSTTTSSTESTTSTSVAPAESTATTAAGGAVAGTPTTTTRAGSTPPVGGSPAAGGKGPAPATPGRYRYKQSGTANVGGATNPVAPEGSLVIDAAKGDGTQVFHRVVDDRGGSTDTTFAFRADGLFMVATTQRQGSGFQSVTFTCTFNPPLPSPPWPPKVGSTFAGKADCGTFSTEVNGKVDGARKVTLDGKSVDVFTATLAIVTHGSLESSGTSAQWFAPSLRMSVHEESHQKGAYGPFGFSSDVTSDLVSANPA